MKPTEKYLNREISWLSFNARVLQEAADVAVPPIERLKFLGIYSNNLDEFFRVRVATYRRMVHYTREAKDELGFSAKKILKEIRQTVNRQREIHAVIYAEILQDLRRHRIAIIAEDQLTKTQGEYVREYFHDHLRQHISPIMLTGKNTLPFLDELSIFLGVGLREKDQKKADSDLALIPVPVGAHSRFLILPREKRTAYILLLDDAIRFCLPDIFCNFSYTEFAAWSFKLTRDAELDTDTDISTSFLESIAKSLKKREKADPVRFVHDREMPKWMLRYFVNELGLDNEDDVVQEGRYQNFKDFIAFPKIGPEKLRQTSLPPQPHPHLAQKNSIMAVIRKRDILLHYPYHTADHFLDLLREAAIDPHVITIRITFYRVAKNSEVIHALINAAANGKRVLVYFELQARFDEQANIEWGKRLEDAGAKIIKSIPDIKVHAKVCLITQKVKGKNIRTACIGTGNFNEDTAKIYTDHLLLTTAPEIASDVRKLFRFLEAPVKAATAFQHLVVSPTAMRRKMLALINREIKHAKANKPARILLKVNNLADKEIIDRLYRASRAGVEITLIVRGVCALLPRQKKLSEGIRAYSLVGRFLEHTRLMFFHNNGEDVVYLSSADMMVRNLDRRIEAMCPILDPALKKELQEYIAAQLRDNCNLRVIDMEQRNSRPDGPARERYIAQERIYTWLRDGSSLEAE